MKPDGRADRIPKIIHQTWKTREIPERCREFQASWQRLNPGWEYRLWTDDDNEAFIEANYPWFHQKYRSYPQNIQRADVVRYFILYHHGGLYVDLDFECLKPFDKILNDGATCFFGEEPRVHSERLYAEECIRLYGKAWVIGNEIMASIPRHRFWEHLFDQLQQNSSGSVIDSTGPRMLTFAYESFEEKESIQIYDEKIFFPLVEFYHHTIRKRDFFRFFVKPILSREEMKYYRDMYENRSFPEESYAVHYWFGSWANKEDLEILTGPYRWKLKERLRSILRRRGRSRKQL